MSDRVNVAVGIIYNVKKDKVLISKRSSKQHLAGYWEFPGGKIESNENIETALKRELNEELGIIVENAEPFTTVRYDYPDKQVLLNVWKIYDWTGSPASRENQQISWSNLYDLHRFKFPQANKYIIQSLSLDSMYVISQESYDDYSILLKVAKDCFKAGMKIFQLRLKNGEDSNKVELVNKLGILAKENNAKLIFNGNPSDITKYSVDGIHLNSKQLLNYSARPISEDYILGASCHNEEELLQAEKLNVNYAFISPVLITKSHPAQEALGWDKFRTLRDKVNYPVYALGGLCQNDLVIAKSFGAHGIAMISAIWDTVSVN
jgi:8-oxo-dGTP diphosphatase